VRRPELFGELLEDFNRYRLVLDAIGWGGSPDIEPVGVDPDRHGWALRMALQTLLELERGRAAEGSAGRDGAPRRASAARNVRAVEELLRACCLEES
jgi:hypothetical protein